MPTIAKTTICLLLLAFIGFSTTLTGTINLPNGTGFTGTLTMALSQPGALSSAGGCGGPIQIVPTYQVRISVINGALQGSPSVYGNDCILPNGTFYSIQLVDNQSNVLMTDQWLITGSSINLGNVISVIISGTTQSLGGVGVILTTPTTSQTVTQPNSTTMTFAGTGNGNYNFTAPTTLPDGTVCTLTGCVFGLTASLPKGLATGYTNNSIFYTGPGGALYLRTTTGADFSGCIAGAPPTGNDGFVGLRIDTNQIQFCSGGTLYRLQGM